MKTLAALEVTPKAVGTHRREHWSGYRPARATGNPTCHAVGSAHRSRGSDSDYLCADGRHGCAGGEEGNHRHAGKNGRTASPHSASQTEMPFHPNQIG